MPTASRNHCRHIADFIGLGCRVSSVKVALAVGTRKQNSSPKLKQENVARGGLGKNCCYYYFAFSVSLTRWEGASGDSCRDKFYVIFVVRSREVVLVYAPISISFMKRMTNFSNLSYIFSCGHKIDIKVSRSEISKASLTSSPDSH